ERRGAARRANGRGPQRRGDADRAERFGQRHGGDSGERRQRDADRDGRDGPGDEYGVVSRAGAARLDSGPNAGGPDACRDGAPAAAASAGSGSSAPGAASAPAVALSSPLATQES